jgi:Ca-activated chloride channel homolog
LWKYEVKEMVKSRAIHSAIVIVVALALISPHLVVRAQGLVRAAKPEEVEIQPIIRSSVNLVTIYASVNDKSGRYVGGLRVEDFEVYDNDIPQKIEYFSEEDRPVSMGIIFDTSSSMKNRLEESGKILRSFLEARNKEDEYFLLTFNTTINLAQDFTSSTDKIIDSLLDVSPSGLTVLNDAIYAGVEKVKRGRHSKRALLLISDGQDNNSWYSKQEISNMLSEADLQLYSINISKEPQSKAETFLDREGRETLRNYAQISGGRAFFPCSFEDLNFAVACVGKELRSQYSLGFSPSAGLDGRWHKLKVRVKKIKEEAKDKLAVRSRNGYQATNR